MMRKEFIKKIESVIGEKVTNIRKINAGYSRYVCIINNRYVLKVSIEEKKDYLTIREINFLENYDLDYTPKLIYKDLSKEIVPYVYHMEGLISGDTLMSKWNELSSKEKEKLLDQLLSIVEDLHSMKLDDRYDYYLTATIDEYDAYLEKVVKKGILTTDRIEYLEELKECIPQLFENAQQGLIHGDLIFNNIIIDSNKKLTLIDFERIKNSYLDREFDPINRMSRNPNSFLKDDEKRVDVEQFSNIMQYIKSHFNEVTNEFMDRLLFFDCMNSLRWLYRYPNHSEYEDILFNKSKKLLK